MTNHDRIGVLFICTGNICRSPLAEGIFLHMVNERRVADRFHIDSAGTGGWHVGELADHRMRATAEMHGVKLTSRARQFHARDIDEFAHLICADESHRDHLLRMGAPEERVTLLLEYDPDAPMVEVPDPYYGGQDGFDLVYKVVNNACAALLDQLLKDDS